MIYEEKNFRTILYQVYEKRVQKNPSYSLRAFARDLDLSSARLSEVMRGLQGLSRSSGQKMARKMGFCQEEENYFCDLIDAKHARSIHKRKEAELRLLKYEHYTGEKLKQDTFHLISDWYHFAILELCALDTYQTDVSWFARRLGLENSTIKDAIERLIRLNMLCYKDDRWIPTEDYSATTDGVPSKAIKKFHCQVLEKLLLSIKKRDIGKRNSSAIIFSLDREQVPEGIKMIQEFRRKLEEKLVNKSERRNDIYCLSIHFFSMLDES